jgi:tetratricopeptide (TPR) repeat protein
VFPALAAEHPRKSPECNLGAYYLSRGMYPEALRALSGVKSNAKGEADERNLKGVALLLAGKPADAAQLFDKLRHDDPTFVEARLNLAVAWIKLKRFADASTLLDAVYQESAALKATAAFHHAIADDGRGDLPSAEIWIRRAVEADPSLYDANLYLGSILEREKRFEDAGKQYQTYLQKYPESVVATLRFGVSALRAGFRETGVKYLRRVVELSPRSPEAIEAQKYLVLWE